MRIRRGLPGMRRLARLVVPELPSEAERAAGGRLLRESAGQHRIWAVLILLSTAGKTIGGLILPFTIREAVNVLGTGSGADMTAPLIHAGIVLAVIAAGDATSDLANAYYGAGVTARLRDRLVRHALRLGVPGRQRFATGDVLSRLTVDTASTAAFVPLVLSAFVALLTLVGAVVALAVLDWILAVTFVLGVPFALLAMRQFVARAGDPMMGYQQLQAGIVARLLDALQGARTIRASGTREREIGRILEPLPRLNTAGRGIWAAHRRVSWQVQLLIALLEILVLAVAGVALSAGRLTAGDLIAASFLVVLAMGGFEAIDTLAGAIQGYVGASRVSTVLTAQPAVAPPAVPGPLPAGPGRVELHDVTARLGDRLVLDRVNLTVPAATSVAVVGRSGAGKSVLVSLLGRLLAPVEGEVRIDGADVSEVDQQQLRRSVAYAFEQPTLLGSSLHDTIAYARPEASRAEVADAARAAQADHFIRRLPQGYDTPLEQAPLSGGETQRLGLARAVLAGARVVVLDDATSSLDTATEVQVASALARTLAGRTSLVVAHRANTAARADLVVWLEEGRVRAVAPHTTLWSDPDYRQTFGAEPERPVGAADRAADQAADQAADRGGNL